MSNLGFQLCSLRCVLFGTVLTRPERQKTSKGLGERHLETAEYLTVSQKSCRERQHKGICYNGTRRDAGSSDAARD